MEVTVVVVRSSIACVAVVSVSVSTNLAKRPGSVEGGRRAWVAGKKGTLRIFRVFFFFLASKKKRERLLRRRASWLLDPLVTKKTKTKRHFLQWDTYSIKIASFLCCNTLLLSFSVLLQVYCDGWSSLSYLDATLGVRIYTCRFKPSRVPWAGRLAEGFLCKENDVPCKETPPPSSIKVKCPRYHNIFFVVC